MFNVRTPSMSLYNLSYVPSGWSGTVRHGTVAKITNPMHVSVLSGKMFM